MRRLWMDGGAAGMSIKRAVESSLAPYGLALGCGMAAWVTTLVLGQFSPQGVYVLFFAAVFVASRYGGLGPGVLTMAVTSAMGAYYFLPQWEMSVMVAEEFVPWVLYVAVSGLTTTLLTKLKETTDGLREKEERLNALNAGLENRVAQRTAELERANKELEAFSYSVSHDLRSPLRAIDGFARIVQETEAAKVGEEGRKLLGLIVRNAERMSELIDDLLAFSKVSRKEIAQEEMDMTSVAQGVIGDLTQLEPEREAQITLTDLPTARGDRAMLQQVFANLISNSLKFTRGSEPPRIEVGGARESEELVYYVRDNGVGFDMNYSDKLFNVFQRLHGPDEFEGTGAGLAIVRRIVTRHGGRVWAEATAGEGATFYFSLPVFA